MSFPHASPLPSLTGGYDPLLGSYQSDTAFGWSIPQRGMLWGTMGTYRTAVGAGKIILTRARTPARRETKSAVWDRRCPQACDRTASKRFTDLARFVSHGRHFRATVAIARRPTRPDFVAHGQHFCAMVAIDRTSTERPNLVYNCRQIRAMVDSYSAARWSLRCSVVIEAMNPI